MAIIMDFVSPSGGRVLIHDECLPKTDEENRQRWREVWRAAETCLRDGVNVRGMEDTLKIIRDTQMRYCAQAAAGRGGEPTQ